MQPIGEKCSRSCWSPVVAGRRVRRGLIPWPRCAAPFLCALLLGALAQPAAAVADATVQVSNGVLSYDAGPGIDNSVSISQPLISYTVVDVNASLQPGSGCTAVNIHQVTCTGLVTSITADGGDGNDSISNYSATPSTLSGGPGDDGLTGGSSDDMLIGGPGADSFWGGGGFDTASYADETADVTVTLDGIANDGVAGEGSWNIGSVARDVERVIGGSGNDSLDSRSLNPQVEGNIPVTFEGGPGNDTMHGSYAVDVFRGGSGNDTVSYAGTVGDLTLTLDGVANDGAENDDIGSDIENLIGGLGSDHLVGDGGPNRLDGGQGDNVLEGGSGDDTLIGGMNADSLYGGPGNDALTGHDSGDLLDGGTGADTFPDAPCCGVPENLYSDQISYAGRAEGVSITFDGVANDGAPGENDNVGSARRGAAGGDGNDTLSGGFSEFGNGGDDTFISACGTGSASTSYHGGSGRDTVAMAPGCGGVVASLAQVGGNSYDGGVLAKGSGGGALREQIANDVENLVGGDGNDDLTGNDTMNVLDGGAGDDRLTGLEAADQFKGGPGTDTVDYFDGHNGVTVTLDGQANDGTPANGATAAENDFVGSDVENVNGSQGPDTLTGDASPNRIDGNGGSDKLDGAGGADTLRGGSGADDIQSIDRAADDVACGADTDTATADPRDIVDADCETVSVDSTAPQTLIGSGPPVATTSSAASFTFTASEPGATFECRLDSGSFVTCSSPQAYASLNEGPHTFQVRATDAAGNTDATPASQGWAVDNTPPQTTITNGPAALTNLTTATLTFNSGEAGSTFECRLDSGTWSTCASGQSYPGLGEGAHSFEVRASDLAGNADPTPALKTWVIDTTAPTTTIDSAPATLTSSTAASFTFSSADAAATFECRLDTGNWTSCLSPRNLTVTDGSHTFQTRAVDQAGNTDPTPASHTWTVDSTAPETTILSGPSGPLNVATASFEFGANESASFECQTDDGAWGSCESPKAYSSLTEGPHTFRVRATDSAGNTDPNSATRSWSVDTTPPDTAIQSGPPKTTSDTSATFTFTSPDAGTSFECRLDDADWSPCSTPLTVGGLNRAQHVFRARARDAAGNLDLTPSELTWAVIDPVPGNSGASTPTPSPSPLTPPTPSIAGLSAKAARLLGAAVRSSADFKLDGVVVFRKATSKSNRLRLDGGLITVGVVACTRICALNISAALTLPGAAASIRLNDQGLRLAAGQLQVFRLRLSPTQRRSIRRAARKYVTITLRSASGVASRSSRHRYRIE